MDILISGAGLVGLSAATALGARWHRVDLVERVSLFRVNESPTDVHTDAVAVADRVALLAKIRSRRLRVSEQAVFVNSDGGVLAARPVAETRDSDDDIEIARKDRATVLAEALPTGASVAFRDSVATLINDDTDIEVSLVSGRSERFDLVSGAGGLSSAVRWLTFGPGVHFARHLGVNAAIADLPEEARKDGPASPTTFPAAWPASCATATTRSRCSCSAPTRSTTTTMAWTRKIEFSPTRSRNTANGGSLRSLRRRRQASRCTSTHRVSSACRAVKVAA